MKGITEYSRQHTCRESERERDVIRPVEDLARPIWKLKFCDSR